MKPRQINSTDRSEKLGENQGQNREQQNRGEPVEKGLSVTVKTLLGAALVIGAVALGAVAFKDRHPKAKADTASLEQDIRQHLSIGSSRSDVDKFLDQRGISHSYVANLEESPENSHTETALIRGTSQRGVVRGDIQIRFKFDTADSKLVNYSVREIFTGP